MHQEASADVSKFLASPVNAYLLVKRLTSDWKKVERVISRNAGSGIVYSTVNNKTCFLIYNDPI